MSDRPASTREPVRTVRSEAARAVGQVRMAAQDRRPLHAVRHLGAGAANVGAAVADRAGRRGAECPACGWRGSRFRAKGTSYRIAWQSECPACAAAARHRGIALVLGDVAGSPTRICHFAPEPQIRHALADAFPDAAYETTDIARDDVDHRGEDIQKLGFADGAYDLVLCNHVLEHVPDDRAAIGELARITAPEGRTLVTVPGDWGQARTEEFPSPDLNGHHRHYGLDMADRLGESFGSVEVVWLDAVAPRPGHGDPHLRHEPLYVCRP